MKSFPSIGILGGVGAIASARFHLDFVQTWALTHGAKSDEDFPFIKHISCELGLSSRGMVDAKLTEINVLSIIATHLSEYPERIAVVCNSISKIIPDDARFITPVKACRDALKNVKCAWLLASESTIRDQIYQEMYPNIEWKSKIVTNQIQLAISGGIFALDLVDIPPKEVIVLGCTELSTMNFNSSNIIYE